MRRLVAVVGLLTLIASGAQASSYLRLDGVTVDPIQYTALSGGGNHSYNGPNLEPGVQAQLASLEYADLALASLDHANLSGAYLWEADFSSADLSFANLFGAEVGSINFSGANLRHSDITNLWGGKGHQPLFVGADLTGADLSQSWFWNVDFTSANLAGTKWTNVDIYSDAYFMNAVLVGADLSGINSSLSYADFTGATYSTGSLSNRTLFPAGFDPVARGMVLVPEPSTALLLGLGLVGLAARRRV